ncbi:deoxyribonuclease-1-like [Trematomus bernacchii]|uniref:deoxyribonuclease-1-like n=1 Tax=Trematomus bernacchii TaxID=40690 RepID=UPI001469E36B|nr:deoxyribonuclease-1-like [Trematomus bernacchii]XP_033982012.1 deoxyribonuclease-1-like [Trematomus bernacchii]XP_033982013.1 deoxyribonuclease-1-like [Trematomus bernacchii]XP_033982014.1 deoxyribonuclease-1-like [Trematomus bernacchii]
MRLLCALGLFLALLHVTSCLLIGAFNIRCFGTGKFDKPEAIKIITEIVQRYDIILIQEVRCNHDLSVPDKLLALVNKGTTEFSYNSSEPLPLGSGSYRERYLFLYRDQTVTVTDSFQYDGKGFMRPPFVVKFSSTQTAVKEFVLIPIHTQPGNAVEELNALVDVVAAAKLKWTNNNIMVLGDFNADGTYVTAKDWKNIRLFTNKNFHWLIANGVDTTVAALSSNTYDRIVVTTEMNNGVVKGSAKVFNFKINYGLTQAQAEDVSDHFPVEVRLEPEVELKVDPPGKAIKRPHSDGPSKDTKRIRP